MSVISIDHVSCPSSDVSPRRASGFALPGYAAAAATKGQRLGLTHRWTPDEAREHGASGGQARMARMTPEERREVARRGGLARWKAVP
jgi:hypothetical protein